MLEPDAGGRTRLVEKHDALSAKGGEDVVLGGSINKLHTEVPKYCPIKI